MKIFSLVKDNNKTNISLYEKNFIISINDNTLNEEEICSGIAKIIKEKNDRTKIRAINTECDGNHLMVVPIDQVKMIEIK